MDFEDSRSGLILGLFLPWDGLKASFKRLAGETLLLLEISESGPDMVVPRKADDACGTEMLCRLDEEAECIGEASFGSSLLSSTAVVVIRGEDAVRYPA